MAKQRTISIGIGKYKDSNGAEKTRWKTIGRLVEKDDGGFFIALDATCLTMEINYLANRNRDDQLICGVFDNDRAGGQAAASDSGDITF